MENINIPSYSVLIPKEKIIRSIQDLYGFMSKASAEINALESSKQDALIFDTAPTSSSTNPVTSGGVYTAISTGCYLGDTVGTI